MIFAGYVQLRRGLMEHTYDGRLSNNEALTLVYLTMLADKETGRGLINAPVLRTYLPGLSPDAAKRVLHSLEEKGYIFRKITPRSPLIYPYWVDKYIPTIGPHKALQLSISEAVKTKDVAAIRYIKPALEGALVGAPVGAPEGAHYNEKREVRSETEENPPVPIPMSASVRIPPDSDDDRINQMQSDQSVPRGRIPPASDASGHVHASMRPSDAGLRWSGDQARGYIDAATGQPVDLVVALNQIEERVGLSWVGGGFRDPSGHRVNWEEAQVRISGQKERKAA